MKFNKLGNPGTDHFKPTDLNLNTDNSNTYALFSIPELHKASGTKNYLKLAEVIGDNLISIMKPTCFAKTTDPPAG